MATNHLFREPVIALSKQQAEILGFIDSNPRRLSAKDKLGQWMFRLKFKICRMIYSRWTYTTPKVPEWTTAVSDVELAGLACPPTESLNRLLDIQADLTGCPKRHGIQKEVF